MLERSRVLEILDNAYAMRVKGDTAEIAKLWAQGATIHIVGAESIYDRGTAAPVDGAVERLIERFRFTSFEPLDVLVEGNRAAARWRIELKTPNGRVATTEMYDLWTFNDDGKALSLVQFTDTALIKELAQEAG